VHLDHDYVKQVGLENTSVDESVTIRGSHGEDLIFVSKGSVGEERLKMFGFHTSPLKSNSNNPVLGSSVPGGMRQAIPCIPRVSGDGVKKVVRKYLALASKTKKEKKKAVSILKIRRNGRYNKAGYYSTPGGSKIKQKKCLPTGVPGQMERNSCATGLLKRAIDQNIGSYLFNVANSGRRRQVGKWEEDKDKRNQQERDRRGELARSVQTLRDLIGGEVVWPVNPKDRKAQVSMLTVLDTARDYTVQLENQVEQLERERREEQQRYHVLTEELVSLQNWYHGCGGDSWNM